MPRYSKRITYSPLTYSQTSVFIHHAPPEVWRLLEDTIAESAPPAHKTMLQYSQPAIVGHLSQRGPLGGSLKGAVHWAAKKIFGATPVGKMYNSFKKIWNMARNVDSAYRHNNKRSEHTNLVASAIQQGYKDEGKRKVKIKNLQHVPYPNEFVDLWIDEEENYVLATVRGSKSAKDWLGDNTKIAVTGDPSNRIGAALRDIADKYAKENRLEVGGHSLGSDLISLAIKHDRELLKEFDRVDLFNPGANPLVRGSINELTSEDSVHYYLNLGDPVSTGLLGSHPQNVVLNKPNLNPLKNHGLGQWIDENFDVSIKIPSALEP